MYWLNSSPQHGKPSLQLKQDATRPLKELGRKPHLSSAAVCLGESRGEAAREHAGHPSPPQPELCFSASPHRSLGAHTVTQLLNLTAGLLKHSSFVSSSTGIAGHKVMLKKGTTQTK